VEGDVLPLRVAYEELCAFHTNGDKMLAEQNLPVEFVPLPFALYRIERT